MNLLDVVGAEGLQQDGWSLTAPTFGEEGQLQVVGWSGRVNRGGKFYILKCNKCSEDEEMFGEGYFRSLKEHIMRGVVACGCGISPNWSKEQYTILCKRRAGLAGYNFIDFVGEWRGASTVLKMFCDEHGEWVGGNISTLTNGRAGCPKCKMEAFVARKTKPDDVMISSFFASGAFHPDTKFWRSERTDSRGHRPYWFMSCPECGEQADSTRSCLQKGQRPCACSRMRQKQCYINFISDYFGVIAVKFGVANNSFTRVIHQDKVSVYEITNHLIYEFATKDSCKSAERNCKEELECGVVLKRDMPDGWSETTWAYNLDRIVEIYERNGGIKKC